MVVATQRYLDLARDYCLRGSEDGNKAWLDDIDRILSRMKQTDLIIFLRSLGHSSADTADMKAVYRLLCDEIDRAIWAIDRSSIV